MKYSFIFIFLWVTCPAFTSFADEIPDSLGGIANASEGFKRCVSGKLRAKDTSQEPLEKIDDERFKNLMKEFEDILNQDSKFKGESVAPYPYHRSGEMMREFKFKLKMKKYWKLLPEPTIDRYLAQIFECADATDVSIVKKQLENCDHRVTGRDAERLRQHASVLLDDKQQVKEPSPYVLDLFESLCDGVAGLQQLVICKKDGKNFLYTQGRVQLGPKSGCERLVVNGDRVHCLNAATKGGDYHTDAEVNLDGSKGRDCANVVRARSSGQPAKARTKTAEVPGDKK